MKECGGWSRLKSEGANFHGEIYTVEFETHTTDVVAILGGLAWGLFPVKIFTFQKL